ncbi:MAG: pyridoxine 5'-phosphate synthase [Rubricoccaceae bacterium]
MTRLSVNLNKVALLRNARGGLRPDVVQAGRTCLDAGAAGLTLHPRPDGRHARAADVLALAELATATGTELNVEGNPLAPPARTGDYAYPGFVPLCEEARPIQATLVPDAAGQLTSDHGWNLERDGDRLGPIIERLHAAGCRVSLFMDPDASSMQRASDIGADRVELYTGPYAEAVARGESATALSAYRAAGQAARDVGLAINAGHDLDLDNLGAFLDAVPGVEEVSIGQALVADALNLGLANAVQAYLAVLNRQ